MVMIYLYASFYFTKANFLTLHFELTAGVIFTKIVLKSVNTNNYFTPLLCIPNQ